MAKAANFRVCPTTGFKVDLAAEKLIKANAVVAVVFLAIGGLFGLLVALTRWPAVHFLPEDWFYLALTAHGLDVLLVWIIFFEIAVLYFASSVLLNSRLAAPKWAWTGFGLMLTGALITNVAVLRGQSSVMFTSYVPMMAEPPFYLGIILFAVGALIGCFVFFGTLVIAKQEKTYEGSVPLVTFGAITAAIIAVFTIASGAIILIPTLLWSLGLVGSIDPIVYKTIWWAMGHSSQQINVAAHVAIWYAIAAMIFGAKPLVRKSQPHGVPDVHPVPADRERASHARRARLQFGMEDIQHELCDVPGGARQHGARHDGAWFNRGCTTCTRTDEGIFRVAAQGTVEQPGVCRHVHVARVLRLHRRYIRRRDGYGADQPDHAQHALRTGSLPRYGGCRHDPRVYG